MRRRVGAPGCPESATGKVFLARLWKGFIRLAHCVLNPITLFNARPQSGKLEKPLAGAYPFPPNGSCMQAYRGLVSFGTCGKHVPALRRGAADLNLILAAGLLVPSCLHPGWGLRHRL
jgi:hypothetical protein